MNEKRGKAFDFQIKNKRGKVFKLLSKTRWGIII
jgi:hypothetical protein